MNTKEAFKFIRESKVCEEQKEFAAGVVEKLTGEKDRKDMLDMSSIVVDLYGKSVSISAKDYKGKTWNLLEIYPDGSFNRALAISSSTGWKLDSEGRMQEVDS